MKVKLVETYVREGVVTIPDGDSVVDAFRRANMMSDDGVFGCPKRIGTTVLSIETDEGGTLLVQQDGNLLLTQAGKRTFTDATDKPVIDEPTPATLRTGELSSD